MAILKVPYNGEWAIIESPSAVKFTEQTLTETEKARVRANIGAAAEGEAGNVVVDSALSDTSENPVQNKVINAALDEKVSMYINETESEELPDGYDIYIDTTDLATKIPIIPGVIYATASSLLPEGFLWCNGAAVSRTEYSELFSAIGTAYGAGDGSTTFNVPDLQTRIPMGAGGEYGLGTMGGEAEHTLTIDEMPSHNHEANGAYGGQDSGGYLIMRSSGNSQVAEYGTIVTNTGGDQSHNNLQPYTVVNYIISTGKGALISATDVVAGIQTLPLAVEYGGTGENNLDSLKETLNATGTVGAFTYEQVNF